MKRRITVLGTGRMGSALALAFTAAGHEVTVWNRTPSKAAPLAERGLRVAAAVAEAVAEAEIVVGNVSDYGATASLLAPREAATALRGKVLVQLATGTPRQAKESAAWAEQAGVQYLEGAIMATPNVVGQPDCTIVYSGPPALFETHAPTLAALGGNALYVGADIGHANALDAAILTVLWASLFGTWHAAALCEAERFPVDAFASALGATMPVLGALLHDSLARIGERRFAADAQTMASVETCHASARLIHDISREHGLPLGLTEALSTVFERATGAGRGSHDMAAAYEGLRPPARA